MAIGIDISRRKPRQCRGTPGFVHRNYFALAVTTSGLLLALVLQYIEKKTEKTLAPKQTEQTVSSEYFSKKCGNEIADKSLDDFKTPKLIKKPIRTQSPKPTKGKSKPQAAKRSAKNGTQSDIRKALTRKQLKTIRDEISSICIENSSDVDPEQMQLAIALSESIHRVDNPIASSSSTDSQESKRNRFTLDQFGFRPRARADQKTVRIPLVNIRTRKRRLKSYDLLLKSAIEKRQSIVNKYSKLLFNIITPVYKKNIFYVCKLSELLEVQCVDSHIFFKSSMTYFEMEQSDVFYVEDLVEKSSVPLGYFLKDWSKIPGRDASPPKISKMDTVDLTIDDQSDLDVLLSGTQDACTGKLKHKNLKISVGSSNINQNFGDRKKQPNDEVSLCDVEIVPSENIHCRRYNKSPDLFEDETSSESSLIIESNEVERVPSVDSATKENLNSMIISQSDEEGDLPKVVLTQVNVTKNCNLAESKCCSQKSCVMELTECVGTAIQSSGTTVEQSQEMFLNDLIDLTQTDVCNINNASDSFGDCTVTQVFESDNGICHFEAFQKSFNNTVVSDGSVSRNTSSTSQESIGCVAPSKKKIKDFVDLEMSCCNDSEHMQSNLKLSKKQNDIANKKNGIISIDATGNLESVDPRMVNVFDKTQILNYRVISNNTQDENVEHYLKSHEISQEYSFNMNCSADRIELSVNNGLSSRSTTVSFDCDPKKQSESTKLTMKSASKSAADLDLSASQSSQDDIVNISDEEFNYSVDRANVLNNSVNCVNNHVLSHRNTFSIAETSCHTSNNQRHEYTANFELGGSSIFNQLPSFSIRTSDIQENELNGLNLKNKTLERLKNSKSISRDSKDLSENTLPIVNIVRKAQKCMSFVDKSAKCPLNSTINVTPMNKNYIVKTDNVTPLPDYNAMDSPDINVCLDNYGIKKLKRKRAVQLLQHIYYETHPVVDCNDKHAPSSDEENKNCSKRKRLFVENAATADIANESTPEVDAPLAVQNFIGLGDEDLPRLSTDLDKVDVDADLYLSPAASSRIVKREILCEPADWVFQKREKAKIHGCRVPLHLAFHNYITARPKVHEMILRYEPVNIDLIHKGLSMEGHKYDPKDLFKFLDKKCITIKTEDRSGPSRHIARRKKKSNEK